MQHEVAVEGLVVACLYVSVFVFLNDIQVWSHDCMIESDVRPYIYNIYLCTHIVI